MREELEASIKEIGGTILELRRSRGWQWNDFSTSILFLLRYIIDKDSNSKKLRELAIQFLTEGIEHEKRSAEAGFYI